jgi:hypothetical protein
LATSLTVARANFDFFLMDIDALLATHERETRGTRGRPSREHDIFKRAALVLLVTAWETFIEDTLGELFTDRLKDARTPNDIDSTFRAVAHSALDNAKLQPNDLIAWAGDGWKTQIRQRFDEEIAALNTPNSDNIQRLFRRYLNDDVTKSWTWQRTTRKDACQRLDALIRLRGELIHRSKELFERKDSITKKTLTDDVLLVRRLVDSTETHFGCQPQQSST